MNAYLKNKTSMSLIELIICAAIFSLIMAACIALLLAGWNSWNSSSAQAQLTESLSQSVSRMTNEIRQSSATGITGVPVDNNCPSDIDSSVNTEMTFSIARNLNGSIIWSPSINYAQSLGANGQPQLMRSQNGQVRILATGITSLKFCRSIPNIMYIQLTASVPTGLGQPRSSTLNFKVLVHNP
jgi:Tfp pilus assembly protein PilW